MFWQEDTSEEQFTVPENVIDLMFGIHCPTLPVDHAWALHTAINEILPWFAGEPLAGLHIIHGADSGNGWERPQGADDLLYLSRRTRLGLRLPRQRLDDAEALVGQTLDVSGHSLEIRQPKRRLLGMTNVLYSRYVVSDAGWDEDRFMAWTVDELKGMRLGFKKVLCGKTNTLFTPGGPVHTRSLMVANLSYEDAVYLQEQGLGPMRTMGCGLFSPQKSF
jgi:CRISPR-associated protein Cas6